MESNKYVLLFLDLDPEVVLGKEIFRILLTIIILKLSKALSINKLFYFSDCVTPDRGP